MCFQDALSRQHQPPSSELSEARRAGPWCLLCPRLHAHPFETALGMLKHLSHAYSSCLLRRQTRQADQEREGRCICSRSGALVLLSQTQVKILKDAQRWSAMEITAGSHPQCPGVRVRARVCVCVHKPKANAAWFPTSSHDAGVKASPLLVCSLLGRTCWTVGKGWLTRDGGCESQTATAASVDSRRNKLRREGEDAQ